jgi:hypothetical protein
MSHGQFASLQSSLFNDLPDQRFIYSNPQQREALATLRYGIETRKGLIPLSAMPAPANPLCCGNSRGAGRQCCFHSS